MSQRWKWRTNLDRHKKDRQAPRSPQTLMQSVTFGCVHIYIHTRDRREFICLFRREGNRGGGERRNSDRSDGGRREGETQTQQRNETERERQMQWMEMCSCCCFTSCWLWRLQSINAFSHCVFFLSVDSRLCTPERIWLCNELQINKADGRHRAAQTGVHVSVFVAFTHMYEEPVEWSSLSPGSDVWADCDGQNHQVAINATTSISVKVLSHTGQDAQSLFFPSSLYNKWDALPRTSG